MTNIYNDGFNNLLVKDSLLPDTTQSTTEKTSSNALTSGELTGNLTMADGFMQSANFVTTVSGWKIDKDGNAEFNDGTFRGDLVAGTIAIGTNGFHVDSSGNMWWGSSTTYAGATIKISSAGSVNLTTGTFSGSLSANTGTLGAITITTGGNIKYGKTAYTDDTNAGFWLGDVSGTAKLNIGSSATKYFHYDGTDVTMLGGTITGGVVQTATTGYRIKLNGSNGNIELLSNDTVKGFISLDGSNSMIIDSADNIYFSKSTSTQLMQLNSDGLLLPSSKRILFSSGSQLTDAGSELQLDRAFRVTGDVYPRYNHTNDCGSDSNAWDDVNAYNFYDKCFIMDNMDAISEIKKIKPLKDSLGKVVIQDGFAKMDTKNLPLFLKGNIERLDEKGEINYGLKKNGEPKTKNERTEELQNRESRSLGRVVDLLLTAIKQLDAKIENLRNDNQDKKL